MVADSVTRNNNGEKTDLTLPVEHEYLSCCLSSAQRGADVDHQDDAGLTDLMHAVQNDHVTCAQVLISNHACVNVQDHSGRTALMYATRHDNAIIFRLLTDSKADVNVQDNAGKTALMYACEMGRQQFCQLLVFSKCDLDKQDMQGKTAFMYAIQARSAAAYYCMCGSNADVNIQDKNGTTALMYAARDCRDLCGALINSHANLNLQDNNGMTALMHAASMFHLKPCQLLFQMKADLKIEDKGGKTALLHVICKLLQCSTLYSDKIVEALNIAEELINNGADVMFNNGFISVLQLESRSRVLTPGDLIKRGHSGLVRLLICNGIVDAEFIHPLPGQRPFKSIVECATSFGRYEVLVYCLCKWYLTNHDLNYIRRVAAERPHNVSDNIRQQHDVSREAVFSKTTGETKCILQLQKAASHVWPLAKLAFIALSSALGTSPDRSDRIEKIKLPPKFKRMLMFQKQL